jgi:hypothetical protein
VVHVNDGRVGTVVDVGMSEGWTVPESPHADPNDMAYPIATVVHDYQTHRTDATSAFRLVETNLAADGGSRPKEKAPRGVTYAAGPCRTGRELPGSSFDGGAPNRRSGA